MSNTLDQLQSCLQTETALVREFLVVLEAESQALTDGGDETVLGASTATKNSYALKLADIGGRRQSLLVALGHTADKAGLDAVAAQHPALHSLCQDLFTLARQASELNAANGIIIETFLAHNQQALDTLRALAGIGDLYDASGRSKPASKGQTRNIKAG
jgi:flagella synthesis protein FlgN